MRERERQREGEREIERVRERERERERESERECKRENMHERERVCVNERESERESEKERERERVCVSEGETKRSRMYVCPSVVRALEYRSVAICLLRVGQGFVPSSWRSCSPTPRQTCRGCNRATGPASGVDYWVQSLPRQESLHLAVVSVASKFLLASKCREVLRTRHQMSADGVALFTDDNHESLAH